MSSSFFSDFIGPFPDVLWEPDFLTPAEHRHFLGYCLHQVAWKSEHMTFGGKAVELPRQLAWFGDVSYAYSGLTHKPLALPPALGLLQAKIEAYLTEQGAQEKFNSVLLNHYRSGQDSIGMHSDDESQLLAQPVIASVSLGVPRTFVFQHKKTGLKHRNVLPGGSLLVMRGTCQEEWRHGIPKETGDGHRVNLTFRRTYLDAVKPS